MENSFKHLALKLSVGVLALGTGLALAPGALAVTAENSNTGADSNNESTVTITNNVDISSNNTANISNNISVTANTGDNSASKNTGDGSVSTGDISGGIYISNDVNGNTLNSIGFDCGGLCSLYLDIDVSNSNTGADSNNEANVDINNDVDITQNNNLNIDNNVTADLNTGGNDADKNTGDGSVKTGDINFDINIDNSGNENVIGAPIEDEEPEPSSPKGPAIIVTTKKEEGKVLAASEGLPVTGGNLPIVPALGLVLAGLLMKRFEETLRFKFLPSKS